MANNVTNSSITADDLVTELARQAAVAFTEYRYASLHSTSVRKIGIMRNRWRQHENAYHEAQCASRYLEQKAIALKRGRHAAPL
jgi:hypothetical protein